MRTFDIQPYVGALPIRFGMTRAEVHALLGAPDDSSPPTRWSGICDWWEEYCLNLGYDEKETVAHFGFSPGNYGLLLCGSPLWSASEHPDPNPSLLRLDPNPIETLGFLMFDQLGVSTCGFHDDDRAQRGLTLYPRDANDKFLEKGKVPYLRRYRSEG